jgi:hypothetical protein
MNPARKRIARRSAIHKTAESDAETFAWIFSHSGALKIAEIANREIRAAKARLRELGIDPEDPPSDADPDSIED